MGGGGREGRLGGRSRWGNLRWWGGGGTGSRYLPLPSLWGESWARVRARVRVRVKCSTAWAGRDATWARGMKKKFSGAFGATICMASSY